MSSLLLVLMSVLFYPEAALAFQRMGVSGGQSAILSAGESSKVDAACMDEYSSPPDSADHFTQVLHGAPDAASVTDVATGESISLQQALAEGQVEIVGEIEPGAVSWGYVSSGYFDEVVVRNKTSKSLRIQFHKPVVLGGSDDSPFPFNAEEVVSSDQGATWSSVQAQEHAAELRAKEEAAREAERQRILLAQEGLLAAGSNVPLDGIYGPETQDAIRALQLQERLNVTGVIDDATAAKIEDHRKRAQAWLLSIAGYYDGGRASPSELSELKLSMGLAPDEALNSSVRRELLEPVIPKFNQARGVLDLLGYSVPIDSDPVAWMELVKGFQYDLNLRAARPGTLDVVTMSEIYGLAAALKNVEYLPDGASLANTSSLLTLDAQRGDFLSKKFFRVDIRLAQAIQRILNEAIGSKAIRQQAIKGDPSSVILVVSDTAEFARSVVRDIIDIDQLGRRIAMDGGVAFRQSALGDKTLIVSSGGWSTAIDVAPQRVDSAFTKIWRLLSRSSPEAEQRKQIASVIKERVGGADVAIVVGHELDSIDFERIVHVPVIRSADAGRSASEIKTRFQEASSRPLNMKKMVVISGLPTNAGEYQALAKSELGGTMNAWVSAAQQVNDYFRALRIPVRSEAHRSLKNAADIIVIFAHSKDGRTVMIPDGKDAHEITAEELARFSADFKKRKPTILLMSCFTGGLGQSSPSMAHELIRLGAGAVIAPKTPIDVRNARDFIEAVFAQDPAKSLVERISAVLRDPRFKDGNIRFIVHSAAGTKQLNGAERS